MPSTSEIPVIIFPGWAAPDSLAPDEEPELIPVGDEEQGPQAPMELSAEFGLRDGGPYQVVIEILAFGGECPRPGAFHNPVDGVWFDLSMVSLRTGERVRPARPVRIQQRIRRPV